MDTNLFRYVLDHHLLDGLDSSLEEVSLTPDDRFAGAQDRVLALFDVAHELQRRTVAFLYILLDVLFRAFLGKHLSIALVEAKGRHLFLVHHHDILAVALDEGDIGLDQPRLRIAESLPGARVKGSNEIESGLNVFVGL